MNNPTLKYDDNDIAIIGMACRFPGANNIDEFWNNLKNGVESISFFSPEKKNKNEDIDSDGKKVYAGGIIEGCDLFDADLFGFNPREAEIMDPQHRLFMECAWEALEHAGYNSDDPENLIGLFAGVGMNTYLINNLIPNKEFLKTSSMYEILTGSDKDYLTTKVSYKLNLKGPSLTVGTACSTSLVAVHLACQELLNYDCDIALAGGVTVSSQQKNGYNYFEGGILSPDGHCRAFDSEAQGTVPGNGTGVVVMKRLIDAMNDNDTIHAIVKGSAINNDGSSKIGYTAPSVKGQVEVIAMAQEVAEVDIESISYIEAHGTGTPLGDPIEVESLSEVFSSKTDKKGFCALGSVKTNIGHLDAAAGIAGLIKTVLSLREKTIPPTLNYSSPNPNIDFTNSAFYVNNELSEWKKNGQPRRAGVSSFGIGGTNAHVILEEAPETTSLKENSEKPAIILHSANSQKSITGINNKFAGFIKENQDVNLSDLAYTLQTGRKHLNHRQFMVCSDLNEYQQLLSRSGQVKTTATDEETSDLCFMFSGQGSQYVNMGLDLYKQYPVFKDIVDYCCKFLKENGYDNISELIYPTDSNTEEASEALSQTQNTQPALFIIEYALAQTYISLGLTPKYLIGHSIGEYVAACIAGVFKLEDALTLVAIRGKLIQSLPGGSMIAVFAPGTEINSILNENLSIAASNSPQTSVISGTYDAIDKLKAKLKEQNIGYRELHTSHAFHSHMMEPILEEFKAELLKVQFSEPKIQYISNVTGNWITAEEAISPDYWVKHLRQKVQFSEGILKLLENDKLTLLEVGPGETLAILASQNLLGNANPQIISSLPKQGDSISDGKKFLNSVGELWANGQTIKWDELYTESTSRIPLPTYSFDKKRFWIEESGDASDYLTSDYAELKKQKDVNNWFYTPAWKQDANLIDYRELSESSKNWLILADDKNFGKDLIALLKDNNQKIITVSKNNQFNIVDNNTYLINNNNKEDFELLIKNLVNSNNIPDKIVFLWGLDHSNTNLSGVELFDYCKKIGFYSLLYLAKSIGKFIHNHKIEVEVITSNSQMVIGTEELCPEISTIFGVSKIFPQEYQNIKTRNIDIENIKAGSWKYENQLLQLVNEFCSSPTGTDVALRNSYRWIKNYEKTDIKNSPKTRKEFLSKDATYLSFDGLEGLGIVFNEYLATRVKAKVIFVEYSPLVPLPPRNEWESWLKNNGQSNDTSLKIQRIYELEKAGANFEIIQLDTSNIDEAFKTLSESLKEHKQIDGIFHSPASFGLRWVDPIMNINEYLCELNFLVKSKSMYLVEKVIDKFNPEFCVVLSSLGSILGGLGFTAYSAGNIFMETFVNRYNKQNKKPILLSNWDFFVSEWKLVEDLIDKETSIGSGFGNLNIMRFAISDEEGEVALNNIFELQRSNRHLIISTAKLKERYNYWIKLNNSSDNASEESNLTFHPRPALKNEYSEPQKENEKVLIGIWEELLGIQPIGIEDSFFDLGGNSLIATKVNAKMREATKLDIPLQVIFEKLNIKEIATEIESLKEEIK